MLQVAIMVVAVATIVRREEEEHQILVILELHLLIGLLLQVVVMANAMLQTPSDEATDTLSAQDLQFYDQESSAACGYEDFLAMLEAYRDFIARYGRRTR